MTLKPMLRADIVMALYTWAVLGGGMGAAAPHSKVCPPVAHKCSVR